MTGRVLQPPEEGLASAVLVIGEEVLASDGKCALHRLTSTCSGVGLIWQVKRGTALLTER